MSYRYTHQPLLRNVRAIAASIYTHQPILRCMVITVTLARRTALYMQNSEAGYGHTGYTDRQPPRSNPS